MQAYSYFYNGKKTTKQDKLKTTTHLDKPRIWIDFMESCGEDLYLFSQGDIVNDSDGKDIELYEGLEVSVFDEDVDEYGKSDPILADGTVIKNDTGQYTHVKWLIKLNKKQGSSIYWLSDLK